MDEQTPKQKADLRRSTIASVVGSTIEWYDFSLFGTAAALVFGALFFPGEDPLTGVLLAFVINAIGVFVRPVGGVVFGTIGDRMGRRALLTITLVMMGIATTAIGLLPTYEQVGILAPILLLTLRVIQGLGAGAEYGGSVTLVAEHAPAKRRGFFTSLTMFGVAAGTMLGAGIFSLVTLLPEDQLMSWGWRIPFLISAVGVALGVWIRLKVSEPESFREIKESGRQVKQPIIQIARRQPRSLVVGACAMLAENGTSYLTKTFTITYVAVFLSMSKDIGLTGVLLASAVSLVTLPLFGLLGDRIGVSKLYIGSAAAVALFAFPFFWLLNTGATWGVWLALILMYGVFMRGMSATMGAYLSSLYGPRVRVTGVTTSKELASPIAGGLSPIVATALLGWADSYWPVALYLILMAVVSVIAVLVGGSKIPPEDMSTAEGDHDLDEPMTPVPTR
ncbi:MFS transporter [Nocardia jinanensis]|uniref:Putative proline/betaine transporter n=1 Tax=Nocardia jinanensis TaxID=382504 RepID=A0A917VSV8_9NOCA|nr:MFS transporter [Nocardia jinanensis]GGL10804.1 MFS transporter [Nocardia jinanensis]